MLRASRCLTPGDLIATRRQQFLETVAPVERQIHNIGGEVIAHAWVNQTLRVRVPAGNVDQLTESDCVASVDAPAPSDARVAHLTTA